jgi:hypothetical protein
MNAIAHLNLLYALSFRMSRARQKNLNFFQKNETPKENIAKQG